MFSRDSNLSRKCFVTASVAESRFYFSQPLAVATISSTFSVNLSRNALRAHFLSSSPTAAAMTHSGEDVMFTSNAGQALEGHVIYKESNVREASSCMAYCLLEKSCTSFNYQPRENLCELNNATRLEDLQNFKQRPGSNYYEANENVVIMKSPL